MPKRNSTSSANLQLLFYFFHLFKEDYGAIFGNAVSFSVNHIVDRRDDYLIIT
jgi:hypothetical protein